MMNRWFLTGISALTLSASGGTAFAQDAGAADSGDWELHGFADVAVKNSYVTARGLVAHTDGEAVHILNGVSATSPGGITLFGTTWLDLNPGGPGELAQEFDFSVGVTVPLAKRLTGGVEYMQYTFPQGGPHDLHNLEFSLNYADPPKGGFSFNPHVKLFWALPSRSSPVALGKSGNTFDVEFGMAPTYAAKNFTLVAPTWITVGPKSFWGAAENGGVPDSNLGVFTTGLKAIVPLMAVKGNASVYGHAQYYNLINDNLVRAKALLNNGAVGRSQFVFAAGLNYRF